MFKVKNTKTDTIFTYPTIDEALEAIGKYKNLQLIEEKIQKSEVVNSDEETTQKPKQKFKK